MNHAKLHNARYFAHHCLFFYLNIQNAHTLSISSDVFSESDVVVSHPSVIVYTVSALCRCLTSRTERAAHFACTWLTRERNFQGGLARRKKKRKVSNVYVVHNKAWCFECIVSWIIRDQEGADGLRIISGPCSLKRETHFYISPLIKN